MRRDQPFEGPIRVSSRNYSPVAGSGCLGATNGQKQPSDLPHQYQSAGAGVSFHMSTTFFQWPLESLRQIVTTLL